MLKCIVIDYLELYYILIFQITVHLILIKATFFAIHCSGMLVNGGIVSASEATSSPSHINATKGSSVWLHWNYTYIGDGRHGRTVHFVSKYEEQIIGIKTISKPSIQALAKRFGQNGALVLESRVPAPFHGRLGVISSNSTLVIYDLRCNDSIYHFFSDVNVCINIGAGHVLHDFRLKPTISLAVYGNVLVLKCSYISLIKEHCEHRMIYISKIYYSVVSDLQSCSCF